MPMIFLIMAAVSLVFGIVVGVSEASFWTGFWAYFVCGFITIPLGGWWFTPQFRVEDEE